MATNDFSNDAEAVARCIKGDPQGFDELICRYRSFAVAVAFFVCRDRALAEDIAQDAFVRAYSRMRQIRRGESFSAWLAQTVKNLALRAMRNAARRDEVQKLAAEQFEPRIENPTASLEVAELLARVDADSRNVLMLKYLHGLKCAEIAARLRIPVGTVTSKISRALHAIRESIKEDETTLR